MRLSFNMTGNDIFTRRFKSIQHSPPKILYIDIRNFFCPYFCYVKSNNQESKLKEDTQTEFISYSFLGLSAQKVLCVFKSEQ